MEPGSSHDSSYIVTARKWRPLLFGGVVGQEHVTRTLRNAVQSGRMHHAYIFNGPRGVGKTTTARVLAKAVNCRELTTEGEPCNSCQSCEEIGSGRSIDVIEIDGASNNSVDDIRKLRDNSQYPPVHGHYKLYIIDEVHMLSVAAFNALLKTLEEPPKHLLFVFATTEPQKVPATILSRCQRFDFRRMQIEEIAAHLQHIASQEGVQIDEESLVIIAKKGDGSMRDSQSIYDQVLSFCGKNVEAARVNEALNLIDQDFFFRLGSAIHQSNIEAIFETTRQVFLRGYDLQECLSGLAEHYRNLLTVLVTGDARLLETSRDYAERYQQDSQSYSQADLINLMQIALNTEQALRFAPQPRLRFEFALVQMAHLPAAAEIDSLLQDIAELKQQIDKGIPIAAAPAALPEQSSRAAAEPDGGSRQGAEAQEVSPPAATQQAATPSTATPQASTPPTAREQTETLNERPPQTGSDGQSAESEGRLAATTSVEQSHQPAPRAAISADELQQRWQGFLNDRDRCSGYFRKMLSNPEMAQIGFADAEVIISSREAFFGEQIAEKKSILAESLSSFFEHKITVTVSGPGSAANNMSLFGSPAGGSDAGVASPTAKPDANAANGQQAAAATPPAPQPSAAAASVEPKPGDTKKAEHPLDEAIVNLFKASEIPSR